MPFPEINQSTLRQKKLTFSIRISSKENTVMRQDLLCQLLHIPMSIVWPFKSQNQIYRHLSDRGTFVYIPFKLAFFFLELQEAILCSFSLLRHPIKSQVDPERNHGQRFNLNTSLCWLTRLQCNGVFLV